MSSRIILNAFDMACVSHQSSGTWRHPSNQAMRYNDLEYWTNMAIELERGCFDCLFIADVLGVYDVYRGSAEASLRDAAQVPVNDPFASVPAMATVTKNLCFGLTAAVTFEHPYILARRLSTLDHLTKGRVAWNVVSSYLSSAAKNVGMDELLEHDERYDMADEYMDVVYKLWEGCWEDGAVHRNRETGLFTDPSKVHPIRHEGKYFKVPGIHLCEPSPQRTPVIFQAGASGRGRQFAARHAEGMFILPSTISQAAALTKTIRDLVESIGRKRESVKICTLLTIVTGPNDAAAEKKYREYLSYSNVEGMLTFFGGWTGFDFSNHDPDKPLESLDNNALRSVLDSLSGSSGRTWTVRDIIKERCVGGAGPVLVGGPQKVCDQLERWVDEGGVDGFNLAYAITPGSITDFVDFIIPELAKRGRVQTSYKPGTFREKLLGKADPFVEASHAAAPFRGAFVGKESVADSTRPSQFAEKPSAQAAE